jgi:hypothetical protein
MDNDKQQGLAAFRAAFGEKSLEGRKFSFSSAKVVAGQLQLWFAVSPMEFVYAQKMRGRLYARTTEAELEATVRTLLERLKAKLPEGWAAAVRETGGSWSIVMVKECKS